MGITPMATATGQVTMSALFLCGASACVDAPWSLPQPSLPTWLALGGLASLSTALAYVIYFRLLAVAGATNLLLVTFLIPVSAIGLGVWILGEHLAVRHLVGLAVIGVGLACIDGRLLRLWDRKAFQSSRR
jgi:drug/metabolite transporter (DMT)-like permease